MLFSPTFYDSIQQIKSAFITADAHSDTLINDRDVFGYVDNQAFEAVLKFDNVSDNHYWIAGEPI